MVVTTLQKPIRAGYKQTEVGVIPEEWEVSRLGKCLTSPPDYGINAPAVQFTDKLPVYIRITDITEDGRFSSEKPVSVKGADTERYYLKGGELVFARTGASVGKSYLYNPEDGRLVFAGFLIRVKPEPTKLIPEFLAAYVRTGPYWSWVNVTSMRSGQPGINGKEYAQLPIPLPPVEEQRATTKALSDVDSLIASLDKLIAKKSGIKTGTMQQLLTGKRRLPGFSREWEATRLGDLGVFSKGKGITKDEVIAAGTPCIRYGEIYTQHNDYIREFRSFISTETAEQSRLLRKGELLFTASGETAAEIGKCVAFIGDEEAYAGGDIIVLTPVDQDSMYLGYLMNHPAVADQKARMAQGDAVVHISARSLAQLTFRIPRIEEQTAIAVVLSDMDAEIMALQARRDKSQALKHGMMQQLLTGNIRLT